MKARKKRQREGSSFRFASSIVCMYMKNAGEAGKGVGVQLVCYDRRERE